MKSKLKRCVSPASDLISTAILRQFHRTALGCAIVPAKAPSYFDVWNSSSARSCGSIPMLRSNGFLSCFSHCLATLPPICRDIYSVELCTLRSIVQHWRLPENGQDIALPNQIRGTKSTWNPLFAKWKPRRHLSTYLKDIARCLTIAGTAMRNRLKLLSITRRLAGLERRLLQTERKHIGRQ